MPIIYVTTGDWGVGTGTPNSAAQIDANFWYLEERVQFLYDNPPTPAEISNITVIGSQMMIYLSNGDSYGPFQLPVAAFEWRDDFADGQTYSELDIIKVSGSGLYMVLIDHVAVAPFDPARTISGDPVYLELWRFDPPVYYAGMFIPDKPGLGIADGSRIWGHLIKTDVYFPANFDGTEFNLSVAPTADLTMVIRRNGNPIGELFFALGTTAGVLTTFADPDYEQFEDGDVLGVMKPTGGVDASAVELIGTFVGTKGLAPT